MLLCLFIREKDVAISESMIMSLIQLIVFYTFTFNTNDYLYIKRALLSLVHSSILSDHSSVNTSIKLNYSLLLYDLTYQQT